MDASGKAVEKEGAAPQVPHTGGKRRRRRKMNEHGGGGWECCLAREGGRGILGAVGSLKTIKVGVPREKRGWKPPAVGQEPPWCWGCLQPGGRALKAVDLWSR